MTIGAEHAIRGVIEKLVDSWNRQDWSSFSRLFAEDADYVTGAGVRLSGRNRIHDELASREPTLLASGRVSLVAESVKLVRPDVAVVLCTWRMGDHDTRDAQTPTARAGLLTIVLDGAAGAWRIIALHNTDRGQ